MIVFNATHVYMIYALIINQKSIMTIYFQLWPYRNHKSSCRASIVWRWQLRLLALRVECKVNSDNFFICINSITDYTCAVLSLSAGQLLLATHLNCVERCHHIGFSVFLPKKNILKIVNYPPKYIHVHVHVALLSS